MCKENERAAAGMVASLSSYVATATLAVLGAQAVIISFVLDKRDDLGAFYGLSVAAFIALVTSIFIGGKGVYEIAEGGSGGAWTTTTTHSKFGWQSGLALLGVILVAWSTTAGHTKASASAKAQTQVARHLQRLDDQLANLRGTSMALKRRTSRLEGRVSRLERRVSRLERRLDSEDPPP